MVDLVAKTILWSFVGFMLFWISLGVFAGAPWDGVVGACIVTALVVPPVYWYARWLQRRVERGKDSEKHEDRQ